MFFTLRVSDIAPRTPLLDTLPYGRGEQRHRLRHCAYPSIELSMLSYTLTPTTRLSVAEARTRRG